MDITSKRPLSAFAHRLLPAMVLCGLALLLVIFLFTSWQQNRDSLYREMEGLLPVLENNSRLLLSQSDHELNEIITALSSHSGEQDWTSLYLPPRAQFSHVVLFATDGSTDSGTLSARQLASLSLSERDRERLLNMPSTQFSSTLRILGGNYLPLCKAFGPAGKPRFMCLLVSHASGLTPWQYGTQASHFGGRLLRDDGVLLMASPLTTHYQQSLGKQIPAATLALIQPQDDNGNARFFDATGLDLQRRMGIAHSDGDSGLVHVLSVPTSYLTRCWIADIKWIVLLWAIAAASIWQQWLRRKRNDEGLRSSGTNNENDANGLLLDVINHIHGAAYRLHLPDHKLLTLASAEEDIFPAQFATQPERHSLINLIHADDQQQYLEQLDKVNAANDSYELVYRIQSSGSEQRWVMDRGKAVEIDKQGVIIEGLIFDITEHILAQQHVEYLATRDPLTELMNRYFFNDELISTIDRMQPGDNGLALLFIDLDRFKTVNDSLGHQVGDRLLKLVAERLRHVVGDSNPIARLGGDEFIVMMLNPASREDVAALANQILAHIGSAYQLDYYRLTTTCSIGITMCPEDSRESYILLRNADTAMYTAKGRGGNCFQFYTEEMNKQVNARLTLESELRRAIKSQEFQLYYQPQVDTETDQLLGAEALIRWVHPTAGIISPAEFIPIAEETGLIREIGDWALLKACQDFRKLNDEFNSELSIAVNVSVRQLDDQFCTRVGEVLQTSGLSADFLELEITESLLMDNVQENIRILESINKMGIRFAMDDFGTGYSSLSYLKQFPISKLKIDRAFINDITTDPDDDAIVQAIIAMAKSLHLNLVAEGVETQEQLQRLQLMACDSYQGYLFSRPLPLHDFRSLLAAQQSDLRSG